jgi:arylsulfatase A
MEKPNIILINCDDLGYGDLGCYGSKINKTPAIDRLANTGVRFTDFYAASSLCSPSRGGMLTGCYPRRIGFDKFEPGHEWVLFPGDSIGLNPEEVTIAGVLKNAGYNTCMVGKWHCGDQPEFLPTRFGFDSYYGLPYSNDMGRSIVDEGEQKQRFLNHPPLPLIDGEQVIEEQPDQTTLTERYIERCIKFIRENRENPFFLYLAHMHVHLPHNTPERFRVRSGNGPYGAAVECVDWATDCIMHELDELDISENTIIIFTSDNGSLTRFGGSNSPLRGTKNSCWEGGFRVPCIISWPQKIDRKNINRDMVTSMDLLPTLARIAGGSIPQDRIIDGIDITEAIKGGKGTEERSFFYYTLGGLCAVRNGKWKYFTGSPYYSEALYNLEEDISEQKNILEVHPEIAARLKHIMDRCRQDLGDDLNGAAGENCRPAGKVDDPKTLTEYDPSHPYMIAMYDLTGGKWG